MPKASTFDGGISVVVPIFNEEANINPLYMALKPVLDKLDCEAEVILVDDGVATGATMRAPNLSIWSTPRVARSAPESPAGKPMKFSTRDEPPTCPPGPSRSRTTVLSPSDAA